MTPCTRPNPLVTALALVALSAGVVGPAAAIAASAPAAAPTAAPASALARCPSKFSGILSRWRAPEPESPNKKYTPRFEAEPAVYRELRINPADYAAIRADVSKEPTFEGKLQKAFELYVDMRLAHLPEAEQAEVRRYIRESTIEESEKEFDATGDWKRKRGFLRKLVAREQGAKITVRVNPKLRNTAYFYAIWAHEIEHAIQNVDRRFFRRRGENFDRGQYLHEFGSVRAEFEWFRMLPAELLAHCVVDLPWRTKQLRAVFENRFADYRANHVYSSPTAVWRAYNPGWRER